MTRCVHNAANVLYLNSEQEVASSSPSRAISCCMFENPTSARMRLGVESGEADSRDVRLAQKMEANLLYMRHKCQALSEPGQHCHTHSDFAPKLRPLLST